MAEKLCCDKRQLCRDTKFRVSNGRQDNFIATEKHYVPTKKSIVATKDVKNCKMNVATQKSMSRHNEELKVEISIKTMIKQWQ